MASLLHLPPDSESSRLLVPEKLEVVLIFAPARGRSFLTLAPLSFIYLKFENDMCNP